MLDNPFIFDCWTAYGPAPKQDAAERRTLSQLLDDLDHFGIAGALARHKQADYYDPLFCNRGLLKDLEPYRRRLFPCWSVLPHQAGDFPAPAEFLREADAGDVRAFYIAPNLYNIPIDYEIWRPLARALNDRNSLIFTPLESLDDHYDTVRQFCAWFKECAVVLVGTRWKQWRLACALMDACPNLHLEFHEFQGNRAVEYFAARHGIQRVLFGSGLLSHSAGAARGFIDWSLLSDADVSLFAGGNLKRLLGAAPLAATSLGEPDLLMSAARQGREPPALILDAHAHVLHSGLNSGGKNYVMQQGDWVGMRELTRRMGVKLTALMSWNGTVCSDVESGNQLIAALVKQYPAEVIGLSSCNPRFQTEAEIKEMCQFMHLDLGCRGMKPYFMTGFSYDDPGYNPWWEFCNTYKLYGLLHVENISGGYAAVENLAKRYPDAVFMIAHAAGSWQTARIVADLARRHKNIMAEITLTSVGNGVIEWLCQAIGSDRVLFGTDAPMRDPRPQLGWCVHSRLSLADKKLVLGENFKHVLKRGMLPCPLPEF